MQVQPFCEKLMDGIRPLVKSEVTLKVNAPKMAVDMNQEYVGHILSHLLKNAAEYTPEGGTITLDYKKRGAHTHQFLVTDTGCGIGEEMRNEVFKPFREIRDLTTAEDGWRFGPRPSIRQRHALRTGAARLVRMRGRDEN